MSDKLKLWDARAFVAAEKKPLKGLKKLPNMVGVTPETAQNLKWKAFKWMVAKDHGGKVLRGFLRHPIKYGVAYLRSLFSPQEFLRDGDFFFYGISSDQEFKELLEEEDTLFILGFSYCHKPFECPSGRFTPDCIRDPENDVCRQCFIGKALHHSRDVIPVIIPTIHDIGAKIFEVVHANPKKRVIFMITACELTLKMFSDWGNMVGIKGIGVRLDGRICNTMDAFALSEEGIKPGLTVVLDETQKRMLQLIVRK